MENKTFYNEILTEHNLHPEFKHDLPDADIELKVEDGVVVDGAFEGDGCAISQASADMMLELVIGRSKEEALHLADLFLKMIKGSITDEEKDELEEASVLQDIAHMPARVKCAVLGWHTMQELLKTEEK